MSAEEDEMVGVTYRAALSELQTIVDRIEKAQVDVDELETVVKRGAKLVNHCRQKLHGTQAAVESALEGLKDLPPTANASVVASIAAVDEEDPFAGE